MTKLKGNSLSREDQVELGRKIVVLVEKKFGPTFHSDTNEGAGVVAKLKITSDNLSLIKRSKSYLKSDFGLVFHNPTENHKNHGRGNKHMILINLSEMSLNTIESIKSSFSALTNGNGKTKIIKTSVHQNENGSIDNNDGESSIFKRQYTPRNQSGKMKFSLTLSSFFSSEEMIVSGQPKNQNFDFKSLFIYGSKKEENYQVLNCASEEIAENIEKIATWLIPNPDILRDKKIIMINLSGLNDLEEKPKAYFCLPPKEDAVIDEVWRRFHRINKWIKPKKIEKFFDRFLVYFSRNSSTESMFDLTSKMGWNVDIDIANNCLVVKFSDKPKLETETHVSDSCAESSKSTKISAKSLFTPAEAIEQFKKMFNDQNIWSKISHERKVKIFNLLKQNIKNTLSNEDFAGYLLSPSNKFFTIGEVVFELQAIFKNPNFLNFSESLAEKIRLRLREELIDLDPDDLAGDLLDLF